jgi:DNA polymerase-1
MARDFAAERADAALRLHMLLKARLVAEHMSAFYETIERPLVPVVAAMEDHGVKVDRAALAEMSRDFALRTTELERAIWRDVGSEFNIGSPKQLGDVLFEKLQLPGGKKGKTGAYGTDASILETLAPLHTVPAQVLEWRQLTKLKSTYADALGEEIDSKTSRVHTSFALAATATAALVIRAQHPEHRSAPRAQIPPCLCRRARAPAAVGRLQPDRIAPGRPCRRWRVKSTFRPATTSMR